jgi:hypothetical protein
MEIKNTWMLLKKAVRICACAFFLMLFVQVRSMAQVPVKIYTIKNGRMYIELDKRINESALDSFISQFNLQELALKQLIKFNLKDSINRHGWQINKNTSRIIAISKPLTSPADKIDPSELIRLAQKDPSFSSLFPAVSSDLKFGYNRFKNKLPFITRDSVVRFYLRNNNQAKRVMLAGSFNKWSPDALPMKKTDSGWIAEVKLGSGKYWYKFIADGKWMIDPDNLQRENDGLGNTNSVFFKTNTIFRLGGYSNAKKVYLAGSFNDWQPNDIRLFRIPAGWWELPVYLAEGTHTYRFIVDGNWIADPTNPSRLPNEFDDFNSVIQIGKPHLFVLNGFTNAKRVLLTGSFNGWRKNELFMKRTAKGWELPYTIGEGNYEYRFIVDGVEMTDPDNPVFTNTSREKGNSYLILGANYTFRLKGYAGAKNVFLAGDFNQFSPNMLAMKREGDEWRFPVHLSIGKHLYKFIVDGTWIIDPGNPTWEQNEFNTGNSVIWIEK